jgi:hypothetical protein
LNSRSRKPPLTACGEGRWYTATRCPAHCRERFREHKSTAELMYPASAWPTPSSMRSPWRPTPPAPRAAARRCVPASTSQQQNSCTPEAHRLGFSNTSPVSFSSVPYKPYLKALKPSDHRAEESKCCIDRVCTVVCVGTYRRRPAAARPDVILRLRTPQLGRSLYSRPRLLLTLRTPQLGRSLYSRPRLLLTEHGAPLRLRTVALALGRCASFAANAHSTTQAAHIPPLQPDPPRDELRRAAPFRQARWF